MEIEKDYYNFRDTPIYSEDSVRQLNTLYNLAIELAFASGELGIIFKQKIAASLTNTNAMFL